MKKRREESAWIKTNESLALVVFAWLLRVLYCAFSSLLFLRRKSDKRHRKVTKTEK